MFARIEHANDKNEQKDEAAFIFRPASVEARRCGGRKALRTASFPQKCCKNPRQAVPMSIVSAGCQLICSTPLSFCESRPGFAESNRDGRGVEVAQIAPSQKAAQANCKIARKRARVRSDQNGLQQLARMWCTMPKQSSSTLSCMCTYSCQAGLVDL